MPEVDAASEGPLVTAHSSGHDRTVLTELGNADAWLASDRVVEVDR